MSIETLSQTSPVTGVCSSAVFGSDPLWYLAQTLHLRRCVSTSTDQVGQYALAYTTADVFFNPR